MNIIIDDDYDTESAGEAILLFRPLLVCGFTIYIAKVVQLTDNKVYLMLL